MANKKESTRNCILGTASRLFQCQGYHGTGLKQIIEESGAPKGSIYYHFPDGKEEIALEAIELMKQHVLQAAKMDLSGKGSAVEAFVHHIEKVSFLFDSEQKTTGLPIGLIASETAESNPKLREACNSAFSNWQSLYAEVLVGFAFNENKAADLGVTINALIEGGCILSMTNGSGEPLRSIAKQIPFLLMNEE
ncbi:TetR/AcrR family transcriptional regulator [Fictibacillus sp. S7]|uniref:TetR/AcrR family transcriptional regulator n=1 Tax=Fictibacillus sp. S7 TaxID=2212476 RepID=UPI001013B85F|nr:TetR/AcrR family transcriptional regulator [Fictibacillus sp. S7]RXZ01983.1 TetR/AcrR family transcriptional regulator [Fictibacillus sp. S7]